LGQHHEEFSQAGLQVVALGLGKPKHARLFCGKLAPEISCYTNEDTKLYRTYGLGHGRSLKQALGPAMWKAVMRATLRGHRQGKATGDIKMLPGTFIVDKQGVIQFARYSKHIGDHPDISQLLQAAEKLRP
jgi:peroxiredoxin